MTTRILCTYGRTSSSRRNSTRSMTWQDQPAGQRPGGRRACRAGERGCEARGQLGQAEQPAVDDLAAWLWQGCDEAAWPAGAGVVGAVRAGRRCWPAGLPTPARPARRHLLGTPHIQAAHTRPSTSSQRRALTSGWRSWSSSPPADPTPNGAVEPSLSAPIMAVPITAAPHLDEQVALLVLQRGAHQQRQDLVEQRARAKVARLVCSGGGGLRAGQRGWGEAEVRGPAAGRGRTAAGGKPPVPEHAAPASNVAKPWPGRRLDFPLSGRGRASQRHAAHP